MTPNYERTHAHDDGSLAHDDPRTRTVEFARKIREYYRTYLVPACQALGIRCPPVPSEIEASSL